MAALDFGDVRGADLDGLGEFADRELSFEAKASDDLVNLAPIVNKLRELRARLHRSISGLWEISEEGTRRCHGDPHEDGDTEQQEE